MQRVRWSAGVRAEGEAVGCCLDSVPLQKGETTTTTNLGPPRHPWEIAQEGEFGCLYTLGVRLELIFFTIPTF
jgi:hypothetical protein